MSKETWLKEHYPLPAKLVEAKDALAHSIRKWQGLTRRELAHHGLDKPPIAIDSRTCALCEHFYYGDEDEDDCESCPIVEYQGFPCTMSSRSNDEDSPYAKWKSQGNPVPMISLLWRTAEATKADLSSLGYDPATGEYEKSGELTGQDPV